MLVLWQQASQGDSTDVSLSPGGVELSVTPVSDTRERVVLISAPVVIEESSHISRRASDERTDSAKSAAASTSV